MNGGMFTVQTDIVQPNGFSDAVNVHPSLFHQLIITSDVQQAKNAKDDTFNANGNVMISIKSSSLL